MQYTIIKHISIDTQKYDTHTIGFQFERIDK